ncbi:MAG TPA: sigma-70 family RNA polymerase sigma factor [Thermaerobacter sp.]
MVRLLAGPLLNLARLILGPVGTAADAEEVAADALVAAWRRINEFDPSRGRFRSWVFMLLKYAALERRRQLLREEGRRVRPPHTLPGAGELVGAPGEGPWEAAPLPGGSGTGPGAGPLSDPVEQVLAREQAAVLRQALDSLPPAERDLLIRRYVLEEPIHQLAREAGISRNAMDSRLWRARRALRAALAAVMAGRTAAGPTARPLPEAGLGECQEESGHEA